MKNHLGLYITALLVFVVIAIPPLLCYFFYPFGDNADHTKKCPRSVENQASEDSPGDAFVIVVDPGHGGYDPGKVSESGIKEKDINLSIALKLKKRLSDMGYSVFLTRDEDMSLADPGNKNKKQSDLNARISMAKERDAQLYISIHQNSYSSQPVKGAQVFYYETSKEGMLLAQSIQKHLISEADPSNTRSPKGSTSYMILEKCPCTAVIVECGFLSNYEECALLCSDDYQEKICGAIAAAIGEQYRLK